ncbi:50S ribosomal protein L17 [Candidatus Comchoanobacter bicostacola]|uniref:50S ribosomal protein L17 n=1 Tax=Candidatus Comchoanobacter bicostacola TaxID=2919598 RepID=A0ABY5DI06_9GAMM|nr:50S ribosomal protein L17 [Candidatus Comchoanobacter bicostacola]UTC24273.1 50S ribosomal protein L17 [Candidatus Comchoanobacter bicostacola]
MRKLNRTSAHRKALLKNLSIALIEHPSGIKTTLPKAKELQRYIERLVTKSKKNDFNTVRYLKKFLNHKASVQKLLTVIGPKFSERPGGYTRVLKSGFRTGDNAPMAIIQFVEEV